MQDALELLDPIGTYLDREPLNSAGLRVKALPSSLPSVFLPLNVVSIIITEVFISFGGRISHLKLIWIF